MGFPVSLIGCQTKVRGGRVANLHLKIIEDMQPSEPISKRLPDRSDTIFSFRGCSAVAGGFAASMADPSTAFRDYVMGVMHHRVQQKEERKRKKKTARQKKTGDDVQAILSRAQDVEEKKNAQRSDNDRVVFVGRCPKSFSEAKLRKIFAPIGADAIEKIFWGMSSSREFKGFLYVTFRTAQEAKAAAALPGVIRRFIVFVAFLHYIVFVLWV